MQNVRTVLYKNGLMELPMELERRVRYTMWRVVDSDVLPIEILGTEAVKSRRCTMQDLQAHHGHE